MMRAIPLYLLTIALLGVAVYLQSANIALGIVALWGIQAAESVFTRKNRDADIVEIQASLAAYKAKHASLERDVMNVADRAKTILGEF